MFIFVNENLPTYTKREQKQADSYDVNKLRHTHLMSMNRSRLIWHKQTLDNTSDVEEKLADSSNLNKPTQTHLMLPNHANTPWISPQM